MTPPYVLVLGASSAIGRAIALELARGHSLLLAGRDAAEIERIASDVRLRTNGAVATVPYDALTSDASAFVARCLELAHGDLEGIVACQGLMDEDDRAKTDPLALARLVTVNFVSPATVLAAATPWFEQRKRGFLVAVSSVAGDRGRQSNYPYGAAKAGLATFLDGLRHRLHRAGVQVLTVKPGFVDTAMTWGLPGLFLVATPQRVARDVVRALRRGKRNLYTPWFWRWILAIVRRVPEPIFLRTKL
jgi:short-subunit dehydrogenase